jgi:hypothetical protein
MKRLLLGVSMVAVLALGPLAWAQAIDATASQTQTRSWQQFPEHIVGTLLTPISASGPARAEISFSCAKPGECGPYDISGPAGADAVASCRVEHELNRESRKVVIWCGRYWVRYEALASEYVIDPPELRIKPGTPITLSRIDQ